MHLLPTAGWPSRLALATLATSAVLLAGCSNMVSSFSSGASPVSATSGAVTGHIHGGNQAVSNATVNLYIAGVNGQSPTAATFAATTTSSTDGYGSFSFVKDSSIGSGSNQHADNHFACPSSGGTDPYVFVVAHGGSTVNGNTSAPNPAAAFIAPMGPCSSINANTFISMSEVVTVATMAAIHQFMNPTGSTSGGSGTPIEQSVSSDGIFVSSAALTNSLDNVANIVDLSTGLARTSITTNGSVNGAAGTQVTITPEVAKINQLANIISSCINFAPTSSSPTNSNCSAIYNAAVPPTNGSTSMPTATMGPASDLLTALYYIFTNLNPGSSNISALNSLAGTGPYTPTLSSAPTDWSIGVNYASNSTCSNGGPFLSGPGSFSIDIFGDLWIGNNVNGTNTLAQLSHVGVPTSCITLTGVTNPGVTTVQASTTVDINKNIYSASKNSSDIYRFAPGFSPSSPIDIPTPVAVAALASDSTGNLFYTGSDGNLYKIASAASTSSFSLSSSVVVSTFSFPQGASLVIDAAGRIWSSAQGRTYIEVYIPSNSSPVTYQQTQVAISNAASRLAVGRSVGGFTSVYLTDSSSSSVELLSVNDSNNNITDTANFAASNAGISNPGSLVIDGARNIWFANTTAASVAAVDGSGNALTPSTGLQKAATSPGPGLSTIAVDAAGNLWIASSPNSVTEIVGGAVPVTVPYSSALQAGRFQSIP